MKKFVSLLLTLVVTLSMSFSVMTVASFADSGLKVTVEKGETKAEVQLSNLIEYKFSTVNNAATADVKTVQGVTVADLLKQADVNVGKDESVTFVCGGKKPGSITFNYSDLFGKRYCYSNISKLNADKGVAKTDIAEKAVVKPVIAVLTDEDTGKQSTKLYFGQKYITERNLPLCYDDVEGITIGAKQEVKAEKDPIFITNATTAVGETLEFDIENCKKTDYIYYTTNGKNPTANNAKIYRYAPQADPVLFNKYKFKKAGYVTVKAVEKACCNLDSKIVSRKFTVKPAQAKITSAVGGKKSATVKIKSQKTSGVTGYKVYYQKDGSTKWNSVKTTKTTCKISKLKKGNSYYIKVRAYAKVKAGKKTKTLYGQYSDVEAVAVK